MDNNNPCLFCSKDKQTLEVISENEFCFALWDQNPVSPGHALVIPKKHIASFFDLTSEEVTKLFVLLQEVKDVISRDYSPDGFNIGINDGEAAGRTIHHLHIHLIPRYAGDVPSPRGGIRHIIPGKGSY